MDGGPPRFPRRLHVPRGTPVDAGRPGSFAYGAVTRSGGPFQAASAGPALCHSPAGRAGPPGATTTPTPATAARLCAGIGLGCSPFVRHYSGNTLSSSGYLDVSVPPVASRASAGTTRRWWVSPFGNPRVIVGVRPLPAAYRSYTTPFFGSRRQGIRHTPTVACPLQTTSRPAARGEELEIEAFFTCISYSAVNVPPPGAKKTTPREGSVPSVSRRPNYLTQPELVRQVPIGADSSAACLGGRHPDSRRGR